MLDVILEYTGYICIALGLFFLLAGSLGVLRFPDFFTRLHPAGVTDSLGAPLCILGLMFLDGFTIYSLKLLILMLALFLTCPTACHAIAKAAYKQRLEHKEDHKKP